MGVDENVRMRCSGFPAYLVAQAAIVQREQVQLLENTLTVKAVIQRIFQLKLILIHGLL